LRDPSPVIVIADLRKIFRVPVREAGLRSAVRSLVRREHRDVPAVDGISFEIAPGEVVGFLGPNGAGKTTTLKMLSGLLYPTSGELRVLGHVPSRRESAFLRQITMVMGNRNQLQWDLPALDSYELIRAIYRLHPDDFRKTRDEFIELLDLGELVRKPVRNLSLGERMKVETAGALLHQPQVLFLDEPTLGLDPQTRNKIWDYLHTVRAREHITIFMTTHYMDEAEFCDRIAIIDQGKIVALGTPVQYVPGTATASFEITYDGDRRRMRLVALGDTWLPGDLPALPGSARWIHVAPLARSDFPAETLAAVAQGRRLSLDGQGLVRPARTGELELDADYDPELLRHVWVLKLSDEEAALLGDPARLPVREVLVTHGSSGATVYARGRVEHVPASAIGADPTGAGDGFCISYIAARAAGFAPVAAARRATAVVASMLAE